MAIMVDDESRKAPYRVKLALDRTMLAWVRTSLAMASFGFGMVAFFRALRAIVHTPEAARLHEGAIRFGTALLLLGLVAMVGAGVTHWRAVRKLERGEPLALHRWPLSVTLGLLIALIGLVGMWFIFHH
jgi:putative membrane protein